MGVRFVTNKTIKYLLYALAAVPLFLYRDFTPDNELRYLNIAEEALRNGSIFTFTIDGVPYADKPPLYLWIVMLGRILFGKHSMFFLGLFSIIPALVVLYIMDKWVKNVVSESNRLLGQLMLFTSGFFLGSAVVLRMDMLMCMFIVLSLYTFFRIYTGEGKPRDTLLFPFYVFMALFTKGPIGIMVPLISTSVFLLIKGEIRSIGKYWGWKTLSVIILLAGIWFSCVYAEGGKPYLDNLLFKQTVNRAVNSSVHNEPFYYYFVAIWYSLAPWSLLFIGILVMGLKTKLVTTDLERFFLVIALSTFATLTLFSSKLQIYLLPAFPFFAYIAVLWLSKLEKQKFMLILVGIPAALFCLAFPGLLVAGKLSKEIDLFTVPIIAASIVFSLSGGYAVASLIKNKLKPAINAIGIGMLLTIFVGSFALPKLNPFIGMGELCHQAKAVADQKGIKNFYYYRLTIVENLEVYLGTRPVILDDVVIKSDTCMKKPAILLFRRKEYERHEYFNKLMSKEKLNKVGNYYYVVFEK
jgi:4-amino-4-deoxy-L-arabinose transferase-like glycosyltransferase